MPHQLCSEYMSGMPAALWLSNTATNPKYTQNKFRALFLPHSHLHYLLSNFCLTYDADDEGEQVNDTVQQLNVPLGLILEHSVDQDGWGNNESNAVTNYTWDYSKCDVHHVVCKHSGK